MIPVIAHRGASKEAKENTLEAFERAIECGAPWIEFDVQLTSEGQPVIHHDPVTDKAPWMPTLEEAIGCIAGRAGLMIELKHDDNDIMAIIDQALSTLERYPDAQVLLGSLSVPLFEQLAQEWPREKLIAIVEYKKDLPAFLAQRPAVVAINRSWANAKLIRQLQSQGHVVWVWTVDEMHLAKQLVEWGVTGIITNTPRQMLS
jgi:glycerophosphoryl diester phosphodiesterase